MAIEDSDHISLTSTTKSQDVPVDSDPPPSFMASE